MKCWLKKTIQYWKNLCEYSIAGTYSVTIEKETLCVASLVGGGAGGYGYNSNFQAWESGGGSGGYLVFTKTLSPGTYTIIVGSKGVAGPNNGTATTAFGCSADGGTWVDGGGKGGNTTATQDVTIVMNKKGNNGGYSVGGYFWDIVAGGGASVYDDTATGYGAGGRAECHGGRWSNFPGYDGYIKIDIVSDATDYDYTKQIIETKLPKNDNNVYFGINQ